MAARTLLMYICLFGAFALLAWCVALAFKDQLALDARIELFRNGDISVSTNGVSTFTPREIPYPHVGIGQNDDWVRTNFVNAADILAVGYANWVDDQVGVDLENGLYKFTATFPDDPPEATLLTVGDLSVVITNAVDYDRVALGRANDSGVIVRCNSSGRVLAHEIGHVCHLSDVYIDRNENEQYLPLRESWLPQDWNNGTGSRFYEPGKCQIDILPQVLVYGVATESDLDIPMGTIRGFVKDGTGATGQSLGNAAVGRNHMIIFPPHTK